MPMCASVQRVWDKRKRKKNPLGSRGRRRNWTCQNNKERNPKLSDFINRDSYTHNTIDTNTCLHVVTATIKWLQTHKKKLYKLIRMFLWFKWDDMLLIDVSIWHWFIKIQRYTSCACVCVYVRVKNRRGRYYYPWLWYHSVHKLQTLRIKNV